MNIAVVKTSPSLKAFCLHGAWLRSVAISVRNIGAARFCDMNTGDLSQVSQPGVPLFSIEGLNGGLITFPVAVPLTDVSGAVVRAVGVSGTTVESDCVHAFAATGVH